MKKRKPCLFVLLLAFWIEFELNISNLCRKKGTEWSAKFCLTLKKGIERLTVFSLTLKTVCYFILMCYYLCSFSLIFVLHPFSLTKTGIYIQQVAYFQLMFYCSVKLFIQCYRLFALYCIYYLILVEQCLAVLLL